jgi:hypothetical protein
MAGLTFARREALQLRLWIADALSKDPKTAALPEALMDAWGRPAPDPYEPMVEAQTPDAVEL